MDSSLYEDDEELKKKKTSDGNSIDLSNASTTNADTTAATGSAVGLDNYSTTNTETTATGYDTTGWSAADLSLPVEAQDKIAQYKAAYAAATTPEEQATANAGANAVRQEYGKYTGGSDGSGYTAYSSDYDMTGWSAADQNLPEEARALIAQYKAGYAYATTPEDKAYYHKMTEAVRQQYGNYTGGESGSEYVQQPDYEAAWDNPYGQQIEDALAKLSDSEYSYDYTQDPTYQAYADAYARTGQSAAETGMAQTASNTGGIASSYGNAVANQALQQYAKKTSDMIPTLEQNAYSKYSDQIAALQSQLNLLSALSTDSYNQYANDQSFDYGQSRDTTSDSQWQSELDYQKQQDAINNYLNYAVNNVSGAGYSAGSGSSSNSTGSTNSTSTSSTDSTDSTSSSTTGTSSLSSSQLEMLNRWYSANTSAAFKTKLAAAIDSGQITKQQAAEFYASKGY